MRKKQNRFQSESDLAKVVQSWLIQDGWDVYCEVNPHKEDRVADIVAIKDSKVWIIEAKLQYNTKVVEQAYKWRNNADFVSIATPKANNFVLDYFVEEHGIGRFFVYPQHEKGYVFLKKNPHQNLNPKKDIIINSLHEKQKESIPGVKGGGYVTEYSLTIDAIRTLLKEKGPLPLNEIVKTVKHHYSNDNVAKQTLQKRLLKVEKDFEINIINNQKIVSLKQNT